MLILPIWSPPPFNFVAEGGEDKSIPESLGFIDISNDDVVPVKQATGADQHARIAEDLASSRGKLIKAGTL